MKFNGPFRPGNALLAALISISGIFCLATGFSLPMGSWIPMTVFLVAFAMLCQLSFCYKRGFPVFCIVFIAACLLSAEKALPSIEYLLYTISRYYNGAYGWGIIHWSASVPTAVSADPALSFIGYLITLSVMWTLCRKKWVGFGLFAGILPFAACCVVTDAVPNAICLCGLLIGLLLLLLTQLTRRHSESDASRLMALLLIPVTLLVSVLLLSSRADPHKEQAQALQRWSERLFSSPGDISDIIPDNPIVIPSAQVNLSNVGPQYPGDQVMLRVQADHTGLIYLRGQSYDTYTGTHWKSTLDTSDEGGWPTSGLFSAGEMTVTTTSRLSLRYFPYYISNETEDRWTDGLTRGKLANPGLQTSYSFQWGLAHSSRYTPFLPLSDAEKTAYLDLPVTTRNTARRITRDLLNNENTTGENAAIIADYVRALASYDLNTPSMPANADDFALWFLEESDTGYCVHFATAATVLLRAANIPARYVTGYIAYTIPGVSVEVTAAQAHAWVEYLDPERGWTVLEATPGAQNIPEVPVPTETTQPEETTSPEQTTQPAETTPQTTRPAQTGPAATQPQESLPSDEIVDQPPEWDLQWLKPLGWSLGICFLAAAQYVLRLRLRRKHLTKGSPNRLALRRWRYVCRLAKLTRQAAPDQLKALAEKAAFSQHRLTTEELSRFDQWITAAHQTLLQQPQPLKFLLRLLLAI